MQLVNFGSLILNMVVIPEGVAAFSLHFNCASITVKIDVPVVNEGC